MMDFDSSSDWDYQDLRSKHDSVNSSAGACTSQWSLECSTVEEWNLLADSLRNSRDTNEKALLSVLSGRFLDSIPDMIEAKVGTL